MYTCIKSPSQFAVKRDTAIIVGLSSGIRYKRYILYRLGKLRLTRGYNRNFLQITAIEFFLFIINDVYYANVYKIIIIIL